MPKLSKPGKIVGIRSFIDCIGEGEKVYFLKGHGVLEWVSVDSITLEFLNKGLDPKYRIQISSHHVKYIPAMFITGILYSDRTYIFSSIKKEKNK